MVKGSHKWPRYLQPVYFDGPPCTTYDVKPGKEEDAQQFLSVSDVDLDIDEKYEVLCWDMKVSSETLPSIKVEVWPFVRVNRFTLTKG